MTDVPLLNAVIFAAVGIVVFVLAAGALAKIAPFDLWREIVQERNVAAAVLAGAVALGLCWIIAATMH
jgi:putative membrane protein